MTLSKMLSALILMTVAVFTSPAAQAKTFLCGDVGGVSKLKIHENAKGEAFVNLVTSTGKVFLHGTYINVASDIFGVQQLTLADAQGQAAQVSIQKQPVGHFCGRGICAPPSPGTKKFLYSATLTYLTPEPMYFNCHVPSAQN